jgi:hypothetical protein
MLATDHGAKPQDDSAHPQWGSRRAGSEIFRYVSGELPTALAGSEHTPRFKTKDLTMFKKLAMATLIATVALPTTAFAGVQDYDHGSQWQRDQANRDSQHNNNGGRRYRDREYRGNNNYRGNDRRYYQDCKRSSGTTGTIAGGAGGAVLGSVLGGGTLGTIAGGVGGALVGRTLDKNHDRAQNRRNGC